MAFSNKCGCIFSILAKQAFNIFSTQEQHGIYGSSTALNGIKEHGVLFTYTPPATDGANGSKRRPPPLSYWVVG